MLRSSGFSTRMIRRNWSCRGSWCGMTIIRIWKQCSRSTYPNLTMRNSIFGCHEAQNKCLPESRARKPLMPQPWPGSGLSNACDGKAGPKRISELRLRKAGSGGFGSDVIQAAKRSSLILHRDLDVKPAFSPLGLLCLKAYLKRRDSSRSAG